MEIENKIIPAILPGSEAWFLSEYIKTCKKNVLYIIDDEERISLISKQLEFFLPEISIIVFPAWDCLFYDFVPPSVSVVKNRLKSLAKLLTINNQYLVICSPQALMQTLPNPTIFKNSFLELRKGQAITHNFILHYLLENGFKRAETASESGDFSVRGSIIDIVTPQNKDSGIRLDFFGNILETIKIFDTTTQLTVKVCDFIELLPASEIILNDQTINNFKNYLLKENIDGIDSPLWEAISNKRYFSGLEHYLPLFYNNCNNLLDYLKDIIILSDQFSANTWQNCYKKAEESYQDRLIYPIAGNFPIKPEIMWQKWEEFNLNLKTNDLTLENKAFPIQDFYNESLNQNLSIFNLLKEFKASQKRTIICCVSTGSLERINHIMDNHEIFCVRLNNWQEISKVSGKTFGLIVLPLEKGFQTQNFALIIEQDILGQKIILKNKKSNKRLDSILKELQSYSCGELVVHKQHGVGQFEDLEAIIVNNIPHDCLRIIYHGGDKLFLPVENIELITKYGSDSEGVILDKLGSLAWQHKKAKIKKRIKEIAHELLKVAAARLLKVGQAITPIKGLYEEFCAKFPYPETEDQLTSIEQIEEDLASGKPMDRLICGDVGFGKTEVAIRAAFIAANNEQHKLQVAIVVPTTLLAKQHYNNFVKRFRGTDTKIAYISRLLKPKEASLVKKNIAEGAIDIIIGTHALFSDSIKFKNLGLLVIDEEQHFGVTQKEKLKKYKNDIHVLTLSATPIPRTLQMSLSGIKELSLIATPPVDRQAIKTFIINFDPLIIREAILREFYRGGRVLFVCPRIVNLNDIEDQLKKLVPEVKISTAHGQMKPEALNQIIEDFYEGKFQVLLSTSIVESGLDIASANTIFIFNANMFGLAALYQLRGRVGRGKVKAYAYLLLPQESKFSKIAKKRLQIMQTLDSLGAGFSLASYDMDLRGYGNLVGDEQSGHIQEIGIELYQNMLEEAINDIKNNSSSDNEIESFSPQINLNLPILIPEQYISDIGLRLGLYKRLGTLNTENEIENFAIEMIDRFGTLPQEFEHLLVTTKIKVYCKKLNIEKLDAGPKGIVISFRKNKINNIDKLLDYALKNPTKLKLKPDNKLVLLREVEDPIKRIPFIFTSLKMIEEIIL